jgi:photosystem II stability/assembly factor-like uncharacterized protein
MKRFLVIAIYFSSINFIYSQWLVGPTVANIGPNPSISAASSTVAWVAGNTNAPVIYKTTDHGVSWTSVPTNGIANNVGIYCIWAIDANNAFAGDGTGNAKVYQTTNGGTSWTTLFTVAGGTSFFNGVVFARNNPSFGVAQCDPPGGPGTTYYVRTTTNSGTTWNALSPQPPGIAGLLSAQHSVFVIDNNFWGFGCDNNGIVDITTNGGVTWTNRFVGRSGFVSGLTFNTDKLSGIAAVNQSGLCKTTDGGVTWANLNVPGINGAFLPFAYWVPATNVVYACSSGGGFKRSTNWGTTWTSMTSGTQHDIRHMDFVLNIGFIYGYAIAGTGATLTLIDTLSALPVQMTYFRYSVDENNVNLEWETEFEINNSGFDVERSDANSNWVKIGFVKGNGSKSTPTVYSYQDRSIQKGVYNYRLKQIDYNGDYAYYGLNTDVVIDAPKSFYLFQNFPNPFNPVTFINFNLPFDGKVLLKIFDLRGREVATIINGDMKSGFYSRSFDASNISSGVYFYKLTSSGAYGNYNDTKKLVVVK